MKVLGQPNFAIRTDKIVFIRKMDRTSISMFLEGACEPVTLHYDNEEGRENDYQRLINAMKEACDEQNKDKC